MEKISIGRAPECMLNIPESFSKVSNEHADIQLADGILTFFDHSSNGTMINGKNVHNSNVEIKRGDKILLADSYELRWTEIERFFPSIHRATERFDGSQVYISGRKTELFDGSQEDSNERETVRLNTPGARAISGQKTEVMHTDPVGVSIRGKLNEFTQAEIEELTEKWHTGAFLSSWVWAISNRIYWPILIIPVSVVPYIGQVASIFLCTYLGLNGYRLAWSKNKDYDFKKFAASQKKWVGIGVFLFIIFIVIQVLSLYIIL